MLIPRIGDVYFAAAEALSTDDPREGHPIVVIENVPAVQRVMVIARSSQTDRFSGLPHPADDDLGLNRDGVFALKFYQFIEYRDFTDAYLEYRGSLDEGFLDKLLDFLEV